MRVLAVVIALVATVAADQVSYEDYKVYRAHPSEEQVHLLAALKDDKRIDFLTPLRRDGSPITIMVDPQSQKMFVQFLERSAIEFEVAVDNMERVIKKERTRQQMAPRLKQGEISFTKYNRHSEINAYLDQLSKDHPDIVSLETIGKSYEGRDLKLIKISTNSSAKKPVIFIDAGIHAREWIAPAVALYTINQLVENSANAEMLDNVDYHILPVLNPDGYEYTHTEDRMWRKTRSPGIKCYGTDANRNFDFHWAEAGSTDDECDFLFHGRQPFSEVETIAIKDYILRNNDKIKLYLSFHSFGQYILLPWSYTSELPEDDYELRALGELAATSIESVSGTSYTVGTTAVVMYPAAGSSADWVKGVAGVELAYGIELPPKYGFDPPTSQIVPIVTETFEGIKAFNDYISTYVD